MGAPKYQEPAVDPTMLQVMQQAKADDVAALQERARDDTASLLARYGSMLGAAGTAGVQAKVA
jgi:hypothetical protein